VIALMAMLASDVSPATASPIAQPPVLLSGAPTDADYPAAAKARGASGLTRILVTIDTEGRGRSCRIVGASGHDDLDAAACTCALTKMRFRPAVDRDGHAVGANAVLPIRWMLGE